MTEFEQADTNGNGTIDKSEWNALELEDRKRVLDDNNSMRDAQRRMTWFALSGMLLYPLAIVLCSFLGLDQATNSLSSIAGVYFVSVSALVGAFFGFSKIGSK
jgi:hypothetical protein|tara:strand:- start:2309 stop:2617 length:309 start_codon:yes stop_codon:yes gene_type:complete